MKESSRSENIPSVLQCLDGTAVKDVDMWLKKRRPEILRLFQSEEYGCLPDMSGVEIRIKTVDSRWGETILEGRAVRNTVEVEAVRNHIHFSFYFVVFIPLHASKPVPVFLTVCNRGIKDSDPARHFLSSFYPVETLVSRGYACASFRTQEVAPDYEEGFRTGFHKLFPEYADSRPDWAWGAISAWAWAASRVMDYFVCEPLIDETRAAVVGHSRGGKTALWCAAQDERFAMAVSSCAGNSGDALSRGARGERIKDIVTRFPYWFCRNYQKYQDNEVALPFDQHMLLSLIAPRPVYTSAKTFDSWADPRGQFESCVLADAVYRLYGLTGMPEQTQPRPECPVHGGLIGHHYKTGIHDMDEYDWNCYLDFADRRL